MPFLKPVSLASANPEQKKLLEGLKAKLGKVPNIYATVAHSPVALEAVLSHGAGLKKGVLSGKEIEAIALAVGQANECDYCVAAHTVIGQMSGITIDEALELRKGKSRDPKLDALIKLAVEITATKGHPGQKTLDAFLRAGYSEAALVEVIAWVAHNVFTNYFNHIAGTEIDFPPAPKITGEENCCCGCGH
jgi:uncharacterized peroxidase-related enzyme